ncbi:MAG: type VI secretion system lipoprotein TssJ [Gammaproteobacteria bacterium]|nr:type VI secretion system lipoprotein TssJ [Gammaproteobacteria bacterium]
MMIDIMTLGVSKMRNHTLLKLLLNISVIILLTSCAAKIKLEGDAVTYLNPDINGEAAPVVITVYQLQNGYAFQQANYAALMSNAAQVLGGDLIDKTSFEVQPGANFNIKEKIFSNTKFIGILAAYRDPNTVSWHKVVPLDKPGSSISLHVALESEGISVDQN